MIERYLLKKTTVIKKIVSDFMDTLYLSKLYAWN